MRPPTKFITLTLKPSRAPSLLVHLLNDGEETPLAQEKRKMKKSPRLLTSWQGDTYGVCLHFPPTGALGEKAIQGETEMESRGTATQTACTAQGRRELLCSPSKTNSKFPPFSLALSRSPSLSHTHTHTHTLTHRPCYPCSVLLIRSIPSRPLTSSRARGYGRP